MSKDNNFIITASDRLNWKIELISDEGKPKLKTFRKYLYEALIVADEKQNTLKLYYELFEEFKRLTAHLIKVTSSGELFLKYSTNDSWYSRSSDNILLSFYEFTLKRVCLLEELDYIQGLKRVFSMSLDEVIK